MIDNLSTSWAHVPTSFSSSWFTGERVLVSRGRRNFVSVNIVWAFIPFVSSAWSCLVLIEVVRLIQGVAPNVKGKKWRRHRFLSESTIVTRHVGIGVSILLWVFQSTVFTVLYEFVISTFFSNGWKVFLLFSFVNVDFTKVGLGDIAFQVQCGVPMSQVYVICNKKAIV